MSPKASKGFALGDCHEAECASIFLLQILIERINESIKKCNGVRGKTSLLLGLVENRELAASSDGIINNVAARRAWRAEEGWSTKEGRGGEVDATQESRPHAAPGRRSRPTCRSRLASRSRTRLHPNGTEAARTRPSIARTQQNS